MADYFVASGGSNTAPYETWAKAATSLATALAAATGDNDRIIIQYDGVPSGDAELAADTTYTLVGNVSLISSTNSGTSTITPTVMGTSYWIGNSTTNYAVRFYASKRVLIYGVTLRTSGSTADSISIAGTNDGSHMVFESCYFWHGNSATTSVIIIGTITGTQNVFTSFHQCTFRFGSTSQALQVRGGEHEFYGCSISADGSIPTTAIGQPNWSARALFSGCDLSQITGTLVGDHTGGEARFRFVNCILGASVTVLGSQTVANKSSAAVEVFNCASGDTHYNFGYYDALGEVTVSTGVYATDAAANNKYDGSNRCSWKVVTTAYCSYHTPFITPWFETYHAGTSAITPSIEVLADRTGSPLKDDEIWGEWSYQGTSGSTRATFVNDRRALAAVAANQADSALTASDWTGETAGSPTPWFGKLAPASAITPAEIGMLRARVCVGKASTIVYVDPSVRYS